MYFNTHNIQAGGELYKAQQRLESVKLDKSIYILMNKPLKFGLKQNSSSWETQLLKDGPCNQNNVTWTNVTGTLSIFHGYTYEPTFKVWGLEG